MDYRIKSARLPDWNYNAEAWYYVTLCTRDKIHWFGKISDDKVLLNSLGYKCKQAWVNVSSHYNSIDLDEFIIMPNHIHGIIIINSENPNVFLGNIVGGFKAEIKRWANQNGFLKFQWQERYYDHIIRNQEDLTRIRNYIFNNPYKWDGEIGI